MSFRLKCTEGSLRGEITELSTMQGLVLGREPSEGEGFETKLLSSKTVSRNHCRIDYDGERFKIVDLGSSNGIRVNRRKVDEAELKAGDLLQIGEFSFLVEGPEDIITGEISQKTTGQGKPRAIDPPEVKSPSSISKLRSLNLKQKIMELRDRFEALDLSKKILTITLVIGAVAHWLISSSMLQDSKFYLLQESFAVGQELVRSLADRNKMPMKEKSAILLDCNFVRRSRGVVEAYILDNEGKVMCPVTGSLEEDNATRTAVMRSEEYDNCFMRILQYGAPTCDFLVPIRDWNQEKGRFETFGFARIEYRPDRAEEALQNLQSVRWKTFFVTLGLLLIIWWMLRIWLRKGAQTLAESVHVAFAGNTQHIEKIESFAALDPVIEEINRLLSRGNQGVKADPGESGSEASFLQSLFQQVLSLEERPVLVVDKDNHVLATTEALANVIPIDLSQSMAHITDVIADTHLQGELVGLLNDLSLGTESVDRALSLSDRVIHVKARPILMNDLYVAAVLIF